MVQAHKLATSIISHEEFGKRFHITWKIVIIICVFLSIILFGIEIFINLSEKTLHYFELAEIIIVSIFLIELSHHFIKAETKKQFFKENWLLILALIPFGKLFMHGNALKITKFFNVFGHSKDIVMPVVAEAANMAKIGTLNQKFSVIAALPILQRGTSCYMHAKKADYNVIKEPIKKKLKIIRINKFVSPDCDTHITNGVLETFDKFVKKTLSENPIYKEKHWYDINKLERKNFNNVTECVNLSPFVADIIDSFDEENLINVIITDKKINFNNPYNLFGKFINGNKSNIFLISTYYLGLKNNELKHLDFEYLKYLRGKVCAYNILTKTLPEKECNKITCIHNKLSMSDLDNLAYSLHVNNKMPVCELHEE